MALSGRGVQMLCPDVASFTPMNGDRALVLARDAWKAARDLAPISEHDAARFAEFQGTLGRLATAIAPLLRAAPISLDGTIADAWHALQIGRRIRGMDRRDAETLLRWGPMPIADLVEDWFHTPALGATIACRGVFGSGLGPRSAGTSAALLIEAAREPAAPAAPCFIRGGPGALTAAMAGAARDAGAEIRTSTEVCRIEASDAGVRSVVLESGEEVQSSLVVSNADPVRTFLGFVHPVLLGPEFVSRVRHYRSAGTMAKLNLALSTLPAFKATASGYTREQALAGRILIAPDVDYIERAFDASKYGRPSEALWLECTIPTLTDPSLAPPGGHVMSVCAQYVPYQLREGHWSDARSALERSILDILEEHAPGLRSSILAADLRTPLDLERDFGLTGGHPFHGEMALDQLYFMRPLPGCGNYRTAIHGLYLCGAGTHPGGGVTGANGAAAARAVLEDLESR
jgi:phytoene dehydrogenase-like protein